MARQMGWTFRSASTSTPIPVDFSGQHYLPYPERAENDLIFGVMTSVGYFFITIVLMIGVIMGEYHEGKKYTVSGLGLLRYNC
jgi:hypothetical protein